MAGAAEVFASDGYEGASMSRIAQVAGVSKGTLYNYFDSKAELFAAFVGAICGGSISPLAANTLDERQDVADMLTGIARNFIGHMLSPSALIAYRVVISEAEKFPELASLFYDAGPARAIRVFADWLACQTRLGRLSVPDPEFAAEQFFALCQTRIVIRRRFNLLQTPPAGEIERVARATAAMFLNAYAAS